MSITAERRMHRYSEEDVAAVVLAAITELRARQGQVTSVPRVWDTATDAARTGATEAVRSVRSGVLPRERYEASRGAGDPPYTALDPGKLDEDRLLWLITQAMTGE
jgi:hypothetical protein